MVVLKYLFSSCAISFLLYVPDLLIFFFLSSLKYLEQEIAIPLQNFEHEISELN